jgi:uncharacterized C2H2 Zn-finger protein
MLIYHDNLIKKIISGNGVGNIMTDDLKVKAGKGGDDGRMAAHPVSDDVKTGDHKPVSGDSKVAPHNMDNDVTTSNYQVKLTCPRCGELTLHAEFPDQYEAWIKCSSCGLFLGMSKDEWHHIENSPNINEKIKKMARKKGRI